MWKMGQGVDVCICYDNEIYHKYEHIFALKMLMWYVCQFMKLEHIFRQDTDAIQISISEFAQGNQGLSKKLNYSCG